MSLSASLSLAARSSSFLSVPSSTIPRELSGRRKIASVHPPHTLHSCVPYFTSAPRALSSEGENSFSNFSEKAKKKAADTSRKVGEVLADAIGRAKRSAEQFERDNDLKAVARRGLRSAGERLEELSFDVQKGAQNFDREYRVRERVEAAVDGLQQRLRRVDDRFQLGYKIRASTADFRRQWPTYQRRLQEFQASSLGQVLIFGFFVWLVLSGWIFQLFFWSFWVVPLLPLLLQSFAKNAIVQGVCPSCGLQFVGPRNQSLMCQRCRGVVWKPQSGRGEGGSGGQRGKTSSPEDIRIIDVDPE